MNEDVINAFNKYCEKNETKLSTISHEVIESCCLAYDTITLARNKNSNPVLSISRSRNDLLFAIRYGTERDDKPYLDDYVEAMISGEEINSDIHYVSSYLFAEATKRAKCYDIFNHGKGITLVITYPDAFIK